MTAIRQAIVILADACPLSLLGCYGNEWIETPALDELAHSGSVYERYYPESVADHFTSNALDATLLRIAAAGVATTTIVGESLDDSLTDAAIDWIEQHQHVSFALVVQLPICNSVPTDEHLTAAAEAAGVEPVLTGMEVTMVNPNDDTELPCLRAGWAARMAHLDAWIGEFRAALRDEKLASDASFIFTVEQGIHLGEQDWIGPAVTGYDAAIHLPLLFNRPGVVGCERNHALTQTADWLAELLRHFDDTAEPVSAGNAHVVVRPRGERDLQKVVMTAKWKLIETPDGPELYAKPEDRFDIRNIARLHPHMVVELLRLAATLRPN